MKRVLTWIAWALGLVVALYSIGRAIVELIVIDYGDPASYAQDWGGPSLAGVLAVHCLPGVVAAVLLLVAWRHHKRVSSGRAV